MKDQTCAFTGPCPHNLQFRLYAGDLCAAGRFALLTNPAICAMMDKENGLYGKG